MQINQRLHEDICILELQGKLSIGYGDIALREAVREALDHGYLKIVLDFRNTKSMDSSGLGELVRAQQAVKEAGGKIVLTGVSDGVQDVLEMTRLIGIFEEFDPQEDALLEIANF